MQHKPTLTTRLIATGCAFLLLAVASIGLTLWVTWKLEGGAASINEAGRMRLYAVRMALAIRDDDAARLRALSARFDESMELLRTGNPERPLFVPWSTDVRADFDALATHWRHARGTWANPESLPVSGAADRSDEFVAYVEQFVSAMEVQISRWTAALHVFQIFMLGMAVVATVVFLVMSYFLVLAPLSRMQHALARVRQGDLATRVPVDSDDEFGQLAQYFNQMADALQSSHEELEGKVREKTASVEEHNQRLAALYAVSALIAEADDLQVLAQGFARIAREVAGADAAMVRWSDAANARYVLLAGDGLPSGFAEREQCLETGACVCSQPKAQARLSVVPVVADGSATRLPHCHEFGFRSVVSIPVRQHQQLLAQVTLLYRQEHRVTRDARELLETLAQHLANGVEGLRVSALEREAAVAEERGLIARELHDSIAQSLAFLKIQTELLQGAIAKGDDAARDRSVAELREGVRECYADVRELLVHFRTRTQDEDIEQALRTTLSKFELQSGLSAHLTMHGQGTPLAPDVQIQVLHVVQEALSNVRKHAQARRVSVSVQRHPCWRFEVRDDGRGFDLEAVSPDSLHVGLGIMADRAARIGALLRVQARPGEGTCVTLELPHKAAEGAGAPHGTAAAEAGEAGKPISLKA